MLRYFTYLLYLHNALFLLKKTIKLEDGRQDQTHCKAFRDFNIGEIQSSEVEKVQNKEKREYKTIVLKVSRIMDLFTKS